MVEPASPPGPVQIVGINRIDIVTPLPRNGFVDHVWSQSFFDRLPMNVPKKEASGKTTCNHSSLISSSPPIAGGPASKLYTDVIRHIYTFLCTTDTTQENASFQSLLTASRVNRLWHHSLMTYTLHCHLRLKSSRPLRTLVNTSHYFMRHIVSVSISTKLTLADANLFYHLPNIRHLTFTIFSHQFAITHLPATLYSLTLNSMAMMASRADADYVTLPLTRTFIQIISRDCKQLRTLEFASPIVPAGLDMSPLLNLTDTLTSLSLSSVGMTEANVALFFGLRQLTYLNFSTDGYSAPSLTSQQLAMALETLSAHQNLRTIPLDRYTLNIRHLITLSKFPVLETLEPDYFSNADSETMNALGKMKNLKRLQFEVTEEQEEKTDSDGDSWSDSDTDEEPTEEEIEEQTLRITSTISTLTELRSLRLLYAPIIPHSQTIMMLSSLSYLTSLLMNSERLPLPNVWIHFLPSLTELSLVEVANVHFSQLCDGLILTYPDGSPHPHNSLTSLRLNYHCYGYSQNVHAKLLRDISTNSAPRLSDYDVDIQNIQMKSLSLCKSR